MTYRQVPPDRGKGSRHSLSKRSVPCSPHRPPIRGAKVARQTHRRPTPVSKHQCNKTAPQKHHGGPKIKKT